MTSSRQNDESLPGGKARTPHSITKAGCKKTPFFPVEGEVFLLTSPLIERSLLNRRSWPKIPAYTLIRLFSITCRQFWRNCAITVIVDCGARGAVGRARMRDRLSPGTRVAPAAATGLELPASHGARAGTRRTSPRAAEAPALAED